MNPSLRKIANKMVLQVKRHSPTILTCLGAAGVVATAVTAVRATPKVVRMIQRAEDKKGDALTKMETVRVAAPSYIPAATIGASTIACIFGANALNRHQQAAITSAYIFLDNAYKEYRHRVKELYGNDADLAIRKTITKKRREPVVVKSEDTVLFFEERYGEYFERTMAEVTNAEYELNRKLSIDGIASLNDFYRYLNLNPVRYGEYIGWSESAWVDFEHDMVELEDGMECCLVTIATPPATDYADYDFAEFTNDIMRGGE